MSNFAPFIPRYIVNGEDKTEQAVDALIASINHERERLRTRPVWFIDSEGYFYLTLNKRELTLTKERIGENILDRTIISVERLTQVEFDKTIAVFDESPRWERRR